MKRIMIAIALAGLLTACVSQQSQIVTGTARPAITPDLVKLYLTPPKDYEEIAMLEATSMGTLATGAQAKMDVVVTRLKESAAALGANGVLILGTGNQTAGGVAYAPSSAGGMGMYASAPYKTGSAIAIFVRDQ